jgi:hypothetical protein
MSDLTLKQDPDQIHCRMQKYGVIGISRGSIRIRGLHHGNS